MRYGMYVDNTIDKRIDKKLLFEKKDRAYQKYRKLNNIGKDFLYPTIGLLIYQNPDYSYICKYIDAYIRWVYHEFDDSYTIIQPILVHKEIDIKRSLSSLKEESTHLLLPYDICISYSKKDLNYLFDSIIDRGLNVCYHNFCHIERKPVKRSKGLYFYYNELCEQVKVHSQVNKIFFCEFDRLDIIKITGKNLPINSIQDNNVISIEKGGAFQIEYSTDFPHPKGNFIF